MRAIMKWFEPRIFETRSTTYELSPLIEAPTTTTDATPMMIPIRVRNERSLWAKIDRSAILAASL